MPTRYVIKKYVLADSLDQAIAKERDCKPDEAWKDDKQPEPDSKPDQIGFRYEGDGYYYSPHMKKNRKKRTSHKQ